MVGRAEAKARHPPVPVSYCLASCTASRRILSRASEALETWGPGGRDAEGSGAAQAASERRSAALWRYGGGAAAHQLAQEDVAVGVERVHNQVHEPVDLQAGARLRG